jgi:hypothetical protein
MQIIFVAATIATCFAPEGNCALLAIGAIDAAEHEIVVNAYAFTTGFQLASKMRPPARKTEFHRLRQCAVEQISGPTSGPGMSEGEARSNMRRPDSMSAPP